jgi:hypothetical protein
MTNVAIRRYAGIETASILVLSQILAALMLSVKSEDTGLDVPAPRVQLEIHFQIVIQSNPAPSVELIQSVHRTKPVSMKDALTLVSAETHVPHKQDVKPKHITLCAHVLKDTEETHIDNATDPNAEQIPNVLLIELASMRTV